VCVYAKMNGFLLLQLRSNVIVETSACSMFMTEIYS